MLKKLFFLLLLFPLQVNANAEESDKEASDELIGMMVVAKATGTCGVLSQLVRFQETTKMKVETNF